MKDFDKLSLTITIPAVNELPFEEAEKWAKQHYRRARAHVDWRKAEKIKEALPIDTADYAVKMTIGLWRLIGPSYHDNVGAAPRGRPNKGEHSPARGGQVGSPLQIALEFLTPYIVQSKSNQFKKEFTKQMKLSFTAICNSNYNPDMVKDVNGDVNRLVNQFLKSPQPPLIKGERKGGLTKTRIDFILYPETVESYDSPRILGIRSKIWEHLTGHAYGISAEALRYPSEPTLRIHRRLLRRRIKIAP
jgi:hypothetical protein